MADRFLNVNSVAVIGAGVSGVAAAIHLKKAGLEVTVFERTDRAGGVWVFNENRPIEPSYPSIKPSVGDVDEEALYRITSQSYHDALSANGISFDEVERIHAPPAAAYQSLKNNVSTVEMEMQAHAWKSGTEEFINHRYLAEYISDAAAANGVLPNIRFRSRVSKLSKRNGSWIVDIASLNKIKADEPPRNDSRLDVRDVGSEESGFKVHRTEESFDAVVVAVGHYHACNVPDIPGLADWKRAYPDRVFHSKGYRHPYDFKDQSVVIVGAGVSSTDIAKEICPIAKAVYQVSRGGQFDIPATFLPGSVHRICAIKSFDALASTISSGENQPIPGNVSLVSGETLCNIDKVILATGYHVSMPFLRDLHADGVSAGDADDVVLVTDGQQTHNLHKDIFYIPDPTLAVVGAPYHVATFSLFEFQAVALAAVYAGLASLPAEQQMRAEYRERIAKKGAGRSFHSLKGEGEEIAYVNDLVKMVNGENNTRELMKGHSEKWHQAYQLRLERLKAMRFGSYQAVNAPQRPISLDSH
ncbi:Flavin-binding monooxygenase-like protein 13 [Elsinoe fawcettii]|nr:Flavin-binding monooxygenase-like protein 13 [Elsinoe fawcettii]